MQVGNNFTIKTQELISSASKLALSRDHQQITELHILHEMLTQEGTLIAHLLKKLEVNAEALKDEVSRELDKIAKVEGGNQYASDSLRKILTQASKVSQKFGDEYVSVEHILLAMLETK